MSLVRGGRTRRLLEITDEAPTWSGNMRSTMRWLAGSGALALGILAVGATWAHAGGCCGGAATVGARGYAAPAARAACCNRNMGGMAMPAATPASTAPAPAAAAPIAAAPAPPGAARAGVYTCPMHPNVVSGVPGSCPVCRMALVRR